MPMMISLRDQHIVSLSGHSLIVKANEPCWVVPALVEEANELGMAECEEQPVRPAIEAPIKTEDNVVNAFDAELDQAVMRILTRNDASDFKKDDTPKVARIIAEMDPKCRRATASEVLKAFKRLRESVNLVE